MNKNKVIYLIEYLSMGLVLSYFIIHNIYFVLIGITFSIYLINIELINSIKGSIYKSLDIKNISRNLIKNIKEVKSNSNEIKITTEESKLTLVEAIEEFGFIPSQDTHNDINGA